MSGAAELPAVIQATLAGTVAGLMLAILAAGPVFPQGTAATAGDADDLPLLQVPVGRLALGAMAAPPRVENPVGADPAAVTRGQNYFSQFNCIGCHAPNGAGGMGPALANHHFIYGAAPAQIYLSIAQGRPNGMPSWRSLPEAVIWDLVAYVQSISKDPRDPWQDTISLKALDAEQVPAEAEKTADPWSYEESFSYGVAPNQHGDGNYPTVGRPK